MIDKNELIEWLKKQRYIFYKDGKTYIYGTPEADTVITNTEEFEKQHQWEYSRNRMIEKTILWINKQQQKQIYSEKYKEESECINKAIETLKKYSDKELKEKYKNLLEEKEK